RLSKRTLIRIISQTKATDAALVNPFEFATAAARLLKERLADHLVHGIRYESIHEWYEMKRLEESFESWDNYVIPASRSPYDKVQLDSEVERAFVQGLERMAQVKMYIKLPPWFRVPTPVGEYNPDWAIVWEDRDSHGTASW